MIDIIYSVGSSMCWVGNAFLQSRICLTQAHAYTAGYAFFAVLGISLFFFLMKRMAKA